MKIFDPKLTGSIEILNTITGDVTLAGNLNVEGALGGAVTGSATASYVDYSNIDSKPTLLSGSAQIATDISGSSTSLSSSIASELLKNTTDTLTGDLTVTGTLTAQDLHVQEVTSSIIFSSGSNKFGSLPTNTQEFTGSLNITGSSTLKGDTTINNPSGDFGAEAILKGTTSTGTPKSEVVFKRGTSGDGAGMVLRTSNSSGTIQDVLTLDTSKNATFAGYVKAPFLTSDGGRGFKQDGVAFVSTYSNGNDANAVNDIGSTSNKWRNAYFSGQLNSATISTTGNATFAGTVSAYGNSDTGPAISIYSDSNHGMRILHRATDGDFSFERRNQGTNSEFLRISRSTGNATFAGDVSLGDDKKIRLGTGNDLDIYHNGTTGNSNIDNNAGSLYISNNADNENIILRTDISGSGATERMRIDGSGNVGIGSTTPGTKLVVKGGNDAANTGVLEISTTGTNLKIGGNTTYSWIQSHASKPLYINQLGNNIILNSGGGNVGIGTTSPSGKLNVEASGNHLHLRAGTAAAGKYWNFDITSNNQLFIITDGNNGMNITNTGDVGIGASTPATKLHVQGAITVRGTDTATNGSLAIQDDYSGVHHLGNIGWNRSSGGPYLSYGLKQDGSGDWKSTYSNFSGERSYIRLDEDSFTLGYAPAQATAIGTVITNVSEKFHFDLGNGRLGIGSTSPVTKLDVTATDNSDTIRIANTGTYGGTISFNQGTGNTNIGYVGSLRAFEGDGTGDNGIGLFSRNRISFYLNAATPSVTIATNGNVGIGTTTPTNGKFVINQNSSAASFGGNVCQLFENFNTTDGQMMSIGFRNNNSVGTTAYIDAVAYDQSIGATDIRFSTYSGTAWSSNMVTFQHTGRVGIGTTSPGTKLEVVGSTNALIKMNSTAGTGGRMDFAHGGSNYGNIGSARNILGVGASDDMMINGDGVIYLGVGAQHMTILSSGNVGIGTTAPGEKLTLQLNTQNQAFSGKNGTDYLWFLRNEAGAGARQSGRFQLMDTDVTTVNIESASNRNTYFNAGNIGIGTASPTKQLHLLRTTGDVRGIMVETTVAGSYAEIQVKAASEFRVGTGGSSTTPNGQFYIYDATAGAHRFDIDANGNIGIGTTTPTSQLEVRLHHGTGAYNKSCGVKIGRIQYGWYTGQYYANNNYDYIHIKTNLWMGGSQTNAEGNSGNTQYIMGGFYIKSYKYGSLRGDGSVLFHNWSGGFAGLTVENSGNWTGFVQNPYTSADGYCVIVLKHNYYSTPNIDLHQSFTAYPWRDFQVTAQSQSNNTTGVY